MLPLLACVLVTQVSAHIGFWHPSAYGFNVTDTKLAVPLINETFANWWFHGYLNDAPSAVAELPAGGTFTAELACNKAWTTVGENKTIGTPVRACTPPAQPTDGSPPNNGSGALHAADNWNLTRLQTTDVKGTAIGIAYESDPYKIKPEDFVVISTHRLSPWNRDTPYHIPEGLPACPKGGCTCMWGWVHGNRGGWTRENYLVAFRCNVTGSDAAARPVPKPAVPVFCGNDTSACVYGAKQMLFWAQAEGNNVDETDGVPPYYNDEMGYLAGPQPVFFVDQAVGTNVTNATDTATTPTCPGVEEAAATAPEVLDGAAMSMNRGGPGKYATLENTASATSSSVIATETSVPFHNPLAPWITAPPAWAADEVMAPASSTQYSHALAPWVTELPKLSDGMSQEKEDDAPPGTALESYFLGVVGASNKDSCALFTASLKASKSSPATITNSAVATPTSCPAQEGLYSPVTTRMTACQNAVSATHEAACATIAASSFPSGASVTGGGAAKLDKVVALAAEPSTSGKAYVTADPYAYCTGAVGASNVAMCKGLFKDGTGVGVAATATPMPAKSSSSTIAINESEATATPSKTKTEVTAAAKTKTMAGKKYITADRYAYCTGVVGASNAEACRTLFPSGGRAGRLVATPTAGKAAEATGAVDDEQYDEDRDEECQGDEECEEDEDCGEDDECEEDEDDEEGCVTNEDCGDDEVCTYD